MDPHLPLTCCPTLADVYPDLPICCVTGFRHQMAWKRKLISKTAIIELEISSFGHKDNRIAV